MNLALDLSLGATGSIGVSAPDVTAPTLSSPTGVQTGSTTATIGATTDELGGILYGVVTTTITTPTSTQVKAGQNSAGAAATFAGNVNVSATGAVTISATGLTASTAYYAHLMHEDGSSNKSNVVTSAQFTTAAAPDTTAPTLSSPVGTQTGATTATIGATTNEGNGTLYGVVTTSSTTPTKAQIKAGQNAAGSAATFAGSVAVSSTGAKTISATGLTASTAYYAHLMHEDAAGNQSTAVSSAQFTTASASSVAWAAATDWTLTNGNLTAERTSTTNGFWAPIRGDTAKSSGTIIVTVDAIGGGASAWVGFDTGLETTFPGGSGAGEGIGYGSTGEIRTFGSPVLTGKATWTTGDIIKVTKSGSVYTFYKNNVSQGSYDTSGDSGKLTGAMYPGASNGNGTGTKFTIDTSGF